MLSSDSARVLRFLREFGTDVVDDKLPEWILVDRLSYLVEQKLVLRLLYLPPGKEPQYPYGLNGYRITPAGLDALEEFDRQQQDEARNRREKEQQEARKAQEARKDRHHDYFVAAFEVFLGFIIGLLAEHFGQIIALVLDLLGVHR